jgi:CubicO group peptidase (beta-lactamase class C family)
MVDQRANQTVRGLLEELVASGEELGLQAAAYLRGELVVDAWAGVADRATGGPVDGRTLFTVYSVGKGITATCIYLLAERGQLDYDAPVARYWPAFAARGKERVSVRDVMTHRAGAPQMPEGTAPELICDWDRTCAAIADLPLLWEPGTRTGYHAITYGWILGEVLRRVDGRPFARFVQEEICAPLGLRDLYFGIPDDVEERVATLEAAPRPPEVPEPPPDALFYRAAPRSLNGGWNRPDVRRACIPAAGGIMTARDVARHYAALIGTVDGVRLLPAERIATATTLQTSDEDLVLGYRVRKALGYWLGGKNSAFSERITAFGHAGASGATAFADPEYGLAVGFTKNMVRGIARTPGESPAFRVARCIRDAFGIPSEVPDPAAVAR